MAVGALRQAPAGDSRGAPSDATILGALLDDRRELAAVRRSLQILTGGMKPG